MRKIFAGLIAGAALTAVGPVLADDITGTITAIDVARMELTLEAGDVFRFTDADVVAGLQAGDAVTVSVHDAGASVQSLTKIEAPVPTFEWSPIYPDKNVMVVFDASHSFDADGEIVRYSWDFGDGGTAEGRVVEHKFKDGYFRVWLTVEDDDALVRKYKVDLPVTETWRP